MTTARKVEERENRKKLILNGALKVFEKKGLEGATMDEIAHEAKFGKGTLYYYFTSKEEVFCAIMNRGWISLWEGIEETLMDHTNPRKTFLNTLKQIVSIILMDPNLYRFLFTAPKAVTHMPEKLQTWKSYQSKLYGSLRGLLEEGVQKGEFPDLDADLMFRAIGGLFHGLLFLGEGSGKVSENEIEELFNSLIGKGN